MKESKFMKDLRKIKRKLGRKMDKMSWEEMQEWLNSEKFKWEQDMRKLSEIKERV